MFEKENLERRAIASRRGGRSTGMKKKENPEKTLRGCETKVRRHVSKRWKKS